MGSLILTLFACQPAPTVIETIVENYIEACCCDDDTGGGGTDDTGDTSPPPPDSPCEDFTAPEAGEVDTIDDCIAEPDPIEFAPEVEWTWPPTDGGHPHNQVMVTPVVGNMNDDNGDGVIDADDIPDVVFTAYGGLNPDLPGAVVFVDGSTGAEQGYHSSIINPLTDDDDNTYVPMGRGGVALGDIDADGIPEACFPTSTAPLICIHADGDVVMVGETPSSAVASTEWSAGYPVIGDMDGDGLAEIAIGRVIWDSAGVIVGEGASSHGGYISGSAWYVGLSIMSDVDGDGQLELVAGNVVYERDGSQLWSNPDAENGFSAVADLDGDGDPDIVTVGVGVAYIMEGSDGTLLASFSVPEGGTSALAAGPPTIADFDADGEPEIGIAGRVEYVVYEDAGSGSWVPLWTNTIFDASGATGASVFDFEADGEAEVIYAGTDELFIWAGSDGTDRLGLAGLDPTDHVSGTGAEYPSLADVDGDGSTEILLASNESTGSGWFGVRSIGSGSGPAWAPSRPVWNQHSYHITNVNDDLSIPTSESPNWDTYNNFRTQDQGERPGSWLPDLTISAVEYCVDCDGGESTFYVVVENQGLGASGPVDMVISADGNTLETESVDLNPQESIVLGPYFIDNIDWIGTLQVDIDPADDVLECDEYNNDQVIGLLPCEDRAG